MISSESLSSVVADHPKEPYARLRETRTLQGDVMDRWRAAQIGVCGAGAVGSRIALEIVGSGASVFLWDADFGAFENQGNQFVPVGMAKAQFVKEACDAIRPGAARSRAIDVRHVGMGVFEQLDVIIDATDDPALARPLTEISNGLELPLLRAAVDGSGALEMGRVLCSSAGTGHACQACSYELNELVGDLERAPCLRGVDVEPNRPPTRAGGPMAAAIAALATLQCQRLVGGNDSDLVYDREVLVDWTNFQLLPLRLRRSADCLIGHEPWDLVRLESRASETTLGDVLQAARHELSTWHVTLEPYLHPLHVQADCRCGWSCRAVGTAWSQPPVCQECHTPMAWGGGPTFASVTEQGAAELGCIETTLDRLGLPGEGAMILAKAAGKPTLRFILN